MSEIVNSKKLPRKNNAAIHTKRRRVKKARKTY